MAIWAYPFGWDQFQDFDEARALLGEHGKMLWRATSAGLPVPPGFVIPTSVCLPVSQNGGKLPVHVVEAIDRAISALEDQTGLALGDKSAPLLLSVRPGSRVPMPGLFSTILNIGLNLNTVEGLAQRLNDQQDAQFLLRRSIQSYASSVRGLDPEDFEDLFSGDEASGYDADIKAALSYYAEEEGEPFPVDPRLQLMRSIEAAIKTWSSGRAAAFRAIHDIPQDWGIAVTVQAMVFGSGKGMSGLAKVISRNVIDGKNEPQIQFRRPKISDEGFAQGVGNGAVDAPLENGEFSKAHPELYAELAKSAQNFERELKSPARLTVAVEDGNVWVVGASRAKPLPGVKVKIACDMVDEGLITTEEAVQRIDPASIDQFLHPSLDPSVQEEPVATGVPASPGAACGKIVFTWEDAEERAAKGEQVILVRTETTPEDVHGMHAAAGVLTLRGGMSSHAAVFARGRGIPCITGASRMQVDLKDRKLTSGDTVFGDGDWITIEGATGQVFAGKVPLLEPQLTGDFNRFMTWSDSFRRMKVRANADTPADARLARAFGAEGIGLCRTEHMFFYENRIDVMREMILSEDHERRQSAIDRLLPMQRGDFEAIFETMAGFPVTIRLLDPPLHEFLPNDDGVIGRLAEQMDVPMEVLKRRAETLAEYNPMLGHRGCRLAISYPEIVDMQARAIFEAAIEVARKTRQVVFPEVMIPLVGLRSEVRIIKEAIDAVAKSVFESAGQSIEYSVGTMIELPRAALRAREIAEYAEFFSFGTNDLTQTIYGISRDDAGGFLPAYLRRGLIDKDPFATLDIDGVGEIIEMATLRGREMRPDIKVGICGEHGGDPASIDFCEKLNLDYVSCSPYRVPIARVSAAQAKLNR